MWRELSAANARVVLPSPTDIDTAARELATWLARPRRRPAASSIVPAARVWADRPRRHGRRVARRAREDDDRPAARVAAGVA
jgi:hypothetical protein